MSKSDDANYYDQIGWLITSFFLIFLGTILKNIFEWTKKPIDSKISLFTIFLIMFFGFIVARLFLRSQYRKMKIRKNERYFFTNISIRVYVIFILLIESFLGMILYKLNLLSLICFIFFIIILILIMLLILLETRDMK